jgi:hypothetical protein
MRSRNEGFPISQPTELQKPAKGTVPASHISQAFQEIYIYIRPFSFEGLKVRKKPPALYFSSITLFDDALTRSILQSASIRRCHHATHQEAKDDATHQEVRGVLGCRDMPS